MAIRLRTVSGTRVALCAAETDPLPNDVYLDDSDHYALAAKFAQDWQGETVDWCYLDTWLVMASQRLRDAETELMKWLYGCRQPQETRETWITRASKLN